MKRFLGSLAVVALIAAALGCSLNASGPVGITKTEAVVAGCQNLGEVSVPANVPNDDVNIELSGAARAKGANYVLIQSDGARSGAAYRCSAPTASASR